jgi:hypothetical protein
VPSSSETFFFARTLVDQKKKGFKTLEFGDPPLAIEVFTPNLKTSKSQLYLPIYIGSQVLGGKVWAKSMGQS